MAISGTLLGVLCRESVAVSRTLKGETNEKTDQPFGSGCCYRVLCWMRSATESTVAASCCSSGGEAETGCVCSSCERNRASRREAVPRNPQVRERTVHSRSLGTREERDGGGISDPYRWRTNLQRIPDRAEGLKQGRRLGFRL